MADTRGIRAGRAYVELGVSDQLTRGLRRAQRQLKAFGDRVRQIGMSMVKASAAAITPLVASSVVFAGFEQRMARVRALTGATGKDFRRLSDAARRLGESTVFSASQAAEAMSFFALAGFDVGQILKAIGPTLNMAAAGQLEIAQAADIAAKVMAGMGIEADNLGNAVDVLTKAMTTANTDLAQLGDAMRYIGPVAKAAGTEFEEVVAAIQLLSNAGIQGDMAGTSLRMALLSLTSPSEQARKTLEALGVQAQDAGGNVRPLADIIEDLQRATANMGTAGRLGVLGRIFPARSLTGMVTLMSQGAGKLRQYTAALRESGGTAARIAGVQLNTLKGDATILKSALEGLAIAVGDALAGPIRVLTNLVTKVVSVVSAWIRENRDLVVIAATAAVAVGAVGTALVALGISAQVASFVLGGLASIMAGVKVALAGVVAVLGAMLSPIGLVVTAVAGLGAAAVAYSGVAGDALNWLQQQFGRLRGFVSKVVTGIRDALAAGDIGLAAEVMWLSLKLVWQQGITALNRVWLEGKRFFLTELHEMWNGARSAFELAGHAIMVGWIETTSFLSKTWEKFVSFFKLSWATIKNVAIKGWNYIRELFDEGFDVKTANLTADRVLIAVEKKLDRERELALERLNRERRQELEAEGKLHIENLRAINQAEDAALRALQRDTAARVAGTEAALVKAREKLAEAIAKAKSKREEAEAEAGPATRKMPDFLAGIEDQLQKLSATMTQKIDVVGTFSAVGIGQMGSSSRAERTAKAVEDTAKNTKQLVKAARTGGLTFT